MSDAAAIARLIGDQRFSYPLLTGRLGAGQRLLPRACRALAYTLRCYLGHRWGRLLFGQQLHWIMTIVTPSRRFVGIVMIDEVFRPSPSRPWLYPALGLLKGSDSRLALETGDGELGFFVDPDFQRQGAALAAVEELCRQVSNQHEEGGEAILKRVWAETGCDNVGSRRFLEKLGLTLAIQQPAMMPLRHERNGETIRLVHYGLPPLPVRVLLDRCHAADELGADAGQAKSAR